MKRSSVLLLAFLAFTMIPSLALVQERSKWHDRAPDLSYIAKLPSDTLLIFVREDSSLKTFGNLVQRKGNRVAADGYGGAVAEKYFATIGESIKIVPFPKGESVITATLGGHSDAGVSTKGLIFPHANAERARILAVLNVD
jgi:tripartite-type tricarboxylate transporter receptor subunit TctC